LIVIRPERALAFIAGLPIERFHGVGPVTARRMRELGIATGAELQARSEAELVAVFGRVGHHYWRIAQAYDDRPVEPHRKRRSLSVETTFDHDLRLDTELVAALAPLAHELSRRLERASFEGRTLTLKLRYADFQIVGRRITRPQPFRAAAEILAVGVELLARRPRRGDRLRLLGLGVSSEDEAADGRQLALPFTAGCSAGW
jgi:DNA polymerase-4